jgi:hypothetical protein
MLAMLYTGQHLLLRGPIARSLVRDDHPWPGDQALELLAAKLRGSVLVPPTLHEDIEHLAVLIYGPPPIVTFAMNGEEDLIEMPRVARLGAPATELIGIRLPELPAPLPDRFIGDDDSTSEQQLFDIAVAEAK